MIDSRAEQSFANGRRMLEAARYREAVPYFKAAMEIGRAAAFQARYLSYYGLSLSLSRADAREALNCCRRAAALEADRPELWWNLGQVAQRLNRRGEAHRSWTRGLQLDPQHVEMRAELARLGIRRAPVLSFLARSHPLNVALGRLRSRGDARRGTPLAGGGVAEEIRVRTV